jgi:hypothetical protein
MRKYQREITERVLLNPDYVVILRWNLREEVAAQLNYIREWGGQFVTAVPELKIAS